MKPAELKPEHRLPTAIGVLTVVAAVRRTAGPYPEDSWVEVDVDADLTEDVADAGALAAEAGAWNARLVSAEPPQRYRLTYLPDTEVEVETSA